MRKPENTIQEMKQLPAIVAKTKVGKKELILNTKIESFKIINKKARVISVPKAYNLPIKKGDILLSNIKPGLTELVNQQIAPLQDKIEGLLSSADSLFAGVSNVLNYESQNNLKLALKGMTESVENINSLSKSMSILIDSNERSLSSTFGNIEITSSNLVKLTDSLSNLQFGTTFKNIESASSNLKNILKDIFKH